MGLARFGRARTIRSVIAFALSACAVAWAPATAPARLGFIPNVNGNPDTVSVFDTVTISELGTPIPLEPGGNANPYAVAVAPDGRHAYVVNTFANSVSVIDVATRTVSGTPIAVGSSPEDIAITPDGTRAYVVNQASAGSITPIALATNSPGAAIPLGANTYPHAIAITPDGTRAYVVNQGPAADHAADTVSVIDITTNTPTGQSITVGDLPNAIAITPDGSRAYVVNLFSQTVSVIDTASNTIVAPAIPVSSASSIAIAPDGGRAYVVQSGVGTGSVAVISTASNTTIGSTIPMDTSPGRIAISPDGARGFVAGGNSSRVRAFDTATNAPVGAPVPPSGQGALAIAITPDQGPAAAFSVSPATAGTPTAFDGSGSSDADGTVSRYDWDFGDGTVLTDGGPSPTHTYSAPGPYTATLTVTDNEGCSTRFVFTGQTAYCNAGTPARVQHDMVAAEAPPTGPPKLTLGGSKKQRLDGAVEVTVACGEACGAVATGTLVVSNPTLGAAKSSSSRQRFKLKGVSVQIAAGQTLTLKLKLPFRARLRATKALAHRGKVKAKVKVTATDAAGNRANDRRTISFRARRPQKWPGPA